MSQLFSYCIHSSVVILLKKRCLNSWAIHHVEKYDLFHKEHGMFDVEFKYSILHI